MLPGDISVAVMKGFGGDAFMVVMSYLVENDVVIPKVELEAEKKISDIPALIESQVPGRGTGLTAADNFIVGQGIMQEYPVFLRDEAIPGELASKDCATFSLQAADHLCARIRAWFFALHKQGNDAEIEDIIKTNGFKVHLDFGNGVRGYDAVFLGLARINHTCRPNAWYRFDEATMKMHLIAMRNIAAGEEVTISYIPPGCDRVDRVRSLNNYWGFFCDCRLCVAPSEAIIKSDNNIAIVNYFQRRLAVFENISIQTHEAEAMIYHAKLEDMIPISGHFLLAGYTYSSYGDLINAVDYAVKALMSAAVFDGETSTIFLQAQAFLNRPTRHWTWKRRIARLRVGPVFGPPPRRNVKSEIVD